MKNKELKSSLNIENVLTLTQNLSHVTATSRRLVDQVQRLEDALLNTKQRGITNKTIEQAIYKIWGYCRMNKDSLCSDTHCIMIREVVEAAVSDVQTRLETCCKKLRDETAKRKKLESKHRMGGNGSAN